MGPANADEAHCCYRDAVRRKPTCADAYNSIGMSTGKQVDFGGAISVYKKAVRELERFFEWAVEKNGNVLGDKGNPGEAVGCCHGE